MTEYSKKRRASVSDESDGGVPHKVSKKNKNAAATATPAGKDDEGNPFWDVCFYSIAISTITNRPKLSNKRRVGVSQFKNMCLINIREYYEKDGKLLPGKKVTLKTIAYIIHHANIISRAFHCLLNNTQH